MGFSKPKSVDSQGVDRFGGGGGGPVGTLLRDWQDVDLDASNFVIYANGASGSTGYTLTWNPDGSLTVTNAGNTTRKWEAAATQLGLILIYKNRIDPRPDVTVAGVADGLWRSEDSTLQFQVEMDECQPGAPDTYAQGIAGGVGFVNFATDQGTTPHAPDYKSTTNATYCAMFQAASGNPGNNVYYPISSSGYANVVPPQGLLAWKATPNGMTRANVRVGAGGQNASAANLGRSVKAHCWVEDDRVEDGGIEYGQSHGCSANFVLDDRYYYAALYVQMRNSTARPTSVTFRNFRFLNQPIRNRSL